LKKTLLFIGSFLFLLIIAVLVGPSFIDWNKYKPLIIEEARKATGYNVDVTGDLSLAILPSPRLKIEGLIVEAPKKVKFENLLTMKSAEVGIQLMPLLKKEIAVDFVKLIDPVITVEILKDGKGSWITKKMEMLSDVKVIAGEEGAKVIDKTVNQAASNALDSIALNSVMIENGSLTFIDHKKDKTHSIQAINTTLKASTLNGPFAIDGGLTYNDIAMRLDVKMDSFDPRKDSIGINAEFMIPEAEAGFSYNGIVGIKAPFDVQGQVKASVQKPAQIAAQLGGSVPAALNQKIEIEGVLTAGQDKIEFNDLIAFVGDARAQGKVALSNFKEKNPVRLNANLKFNQVIDLNKVSAISSDNVSGQKNVAANDTTTNNKGFIPSSLTLPMAIDAVIAFDTPGIDFDGKSFKGVFVSLDKKGAKSVVTFKALGIPGQGKTEGKVNLAYASSSVSSSTGAVTYADPTASFAIDGYVGQFDNAVKAFVPKIDNKTAQLFKAVRWDLKGVLSPKSISLKDSVLKLDDSVIGLGGRYTPSLAGGRDQVAIDISATELDLDKLSGGSKTVSGAEQVQSTGSSKAGGNANDALKPLKEFNLPVDAVFDISIQKLQANGVTINGVRLTCESVGNKLTLKNASVNDYLGAAMSANGVIGNRSDLSGLDLTLGLKTQDIQSFAKAIKVDASKLPETLKAVDASATVKGAIDSLSTSANIKAMNGQLDISGLIKNAMTKPQISDMGVGLKHPNFIQAIRVVSPDFKSSEGLAQPINFAAKVSLNDKVITLSEMKTTLGASTFSGNLKIDQTGSKQSITGALQAGTIALDQLLGAKTASQSARGADASGASASSSKERWSKTPINVDWMNTMNVDLDLSANSITYGAWNFSQPSTTIKVQNGALNINGMKAEVFGGQATLNAGVNAPSQSGGPLSIKIDTAMNDISLEALAFALSKSKKLQSSGTVAFNLDVTSNGESANALINALDGTAALNGKNIIIKGFDLNKMARGLAVNDKLIDSVTSLIDGATSGGQTQFDTLDGAYKITKGVVNIESMTLESETSKIASTGFVNLPEWTINTDHLITLKQITDLEPFTVKIKGPLDNPADTFGKKVLEDYVSDKLKRKLVKELPDVLGSDVTNKLQQFGILPREQNKPPVTTDTPANDNAVPEPDPTNNVAPETAVVPTAEPVVEPKKIEKPEDALNEILNSETPEDAVNNLLKGLF